MSNTPSIIVPAAGLRPDHLGTDTRALGEWRKTNNTVAVAMALNDVKMRLGMTGPEVFGALVENVIVGIQAGTAPSQWREIGDAVCGTIMKRMTVR